jgi:adenylate cyclase
LCREYKTALDAAERVIRSYPDFPLPYRWLAATLGQLGRADKARSALKKATAIGAAALYMYVRNRVPWQRPEDHAHMLEGLRKAGWQG